MKCSLIAWFLSTAWETCHISQQLRVMTNILYKCLFHFYVSHKSHLWIFWSFTSVVRNGIQMKVSKNKVASWLCSVYSRVVVSLCTVTAVLFHIWVPSCSFCWEFAMHKMLMFFLYTCVVRYTFSTNFSVRVFRFHK